MTGQRVSSQQQTADFEAIVRRAFVNDEPGPTCNHDGCGQQATFRFVGSEPPCLLHGELRFCDEHTTTRNNILTTMQPDYVVICHFDCGHRLGAARDCRFLPI